MDVAAHIFNINCKQRIVRELNVLITSAIALFSLYITFVSVLERSFFAPFMTTSQILPNNNNLTNTTNQTALYITFRNNNNNSSSSFLLVNNNDSSTTDNGTNNDNDIEMQENDDKQKAASFVASFFSLFFLWFLALIAGRLTHYVRLPPLLGMLLVGVLFANIPSLKQMLMVDSNWDRLARSMAFVLIMLRCGIGLNPEVLRKSLLFCTSLGVCSTVIEIVAIMFTAHFLYGMPIPVAVLFSFVLASTSPAVTVPTMIKLQHQHYGTKKGIPTIALASASIDNIFCITGFAITHSIVSASDKELGRTLILTPVQIFGGLILGCLIGGILRFFPSPHTKSSLHFHRTLLLCSLSLALYYGIKAIHFGVSGPIAVILTCFLAGSGWKKDNSEGTRIEAEALRVLWNQLLLPLLFVLIGLLFDLSIFTLDLLEEAFFVICIGIVARALSVILVVTLFNGKNNNDDNSRSIYLNIKERMFFSSIFIPKATVQAALAPVLFDYAMSRSGNTGIRIGTDTGNAIEKSTVAEFTLQACILSIFLTAPIGQLLIQNGGQKFLHRDEKISTKNARNNSIRERNFSTPVFVVDGFQERKEEAGDEEKQAEEMETDIYAEKDCVNKEDANEDHK